MSLPKFDPYAPIEKLEAADAQPVAVAKSNLRAVPAPAKRPVTAEVAHRASRVQAEREDRWLEALRRGREAAAAEGLSVDYEHRLAFTKCLIREVYEAGGSFRIDGDGIVLVSNGRLWRGLVDDVERNADEVIYLIKYGVNWRDS